MSTTTTTTTTGRAVELCRYATDTGERILVARRIETEIHVYDVPCSAGRSYFVERGFESKAELAALVADYLRQAERLGACPMSRDAIAALTTPIR